MLEMWNNYHVNHLYSGEKRHRPIVIIAILCKVASSFSTLFFSLFIGYLDRVRLSFIRSLLKWAQNLVGRLFRVHTNCVIHFPGDLVIFFYSNYIFIMLTIWRTMGSLKFQIFKNAFLQQRWKDITLTEAINRRENPLFKLNP